MEDSIAPETQAPQAAPESQHPDSQSMAVARAKRDALVKELFRVAPKCHPPQPRVQNIPKSSTAVVDKANESVPGDSGLGTYYVNGVHLDLYDYFSLPLQGITSDTLRKLQFVNDKIAARGDFDSGLRELHKLDVKLGSATVGEVKLSKIYNFIRFSGKSREA